MMKSSIGNDKDSIPTAIPVAKVVPTHPGSSVGSVGLIEDPNLRGFVVRQETQAAEVVGQMVGLPIEIGNKYKVSALPAGVQAQHRPGDKHGWRPSADDLKHLDQLLFVQEDSSMIVNAIYHMMGMNNLRPFRMRFFINDGGEVFAIDRPFKCGGVCGCPLEMNVLRRYNKVADHDGSRYEPANDILIGRVYEDFENYGRSCFSACCLGIHYHNIQRAVFDENGHTKFETAFTVTANESCCGPTNNCCGATIFRNDAVYIIYDNKGNEVGYIQKTYAGKGDCMGALCRSCYHYDNYILEFPEGATTADDRILILTSIFQIDYQLFEEKGGNNGGGGGGGGGGD